MEQTLDMFRSWGTPEEIVFEISSTEDYYQVMGYGTPQILLNHMDYLPIPGMKIQCVLTPGHSPGHLCFYDHENNLFFSGDHVLPRISPFVALNPYGPENPLKLYLESLDQLEQFSAAEVLPAHEFRFRDLSTRLDELRAGIYDRLDEINSIAGDSVHAEHIWSLATQLSWSRPWEDFSPLDKRMALCEIASHIVYLNTSELR